MPHRIGVCSWSLQPASPEALVEALQSIGVTAVQLALDPIRTGAWDEEATKRALVEAGITPVSGMWAPEGEDYSTLETIKETGGVRPDQHWDANKDAARANAAIAQRLGIPMVTFHAGFIPHGASDPERATMLDRLREVSSIFNEHGVTVSLETGQDTAESLMAVLSELGSGVVGVNFDPANMILYGMGDPIDAVRELAPHIRQVHIKDAKATESPGTWGTEVRVGHGDVDWAMFIVEVESACPDIDLMIEREAGEDRLSDMAAAKQCVATLLA